jgi:hypothetical protein
MIESINQGCEGSVKIIVANQKRKKMKKLIFELMIPLSICGIGTVLSVVSVVNVFKMTGA